MNNVKAIQKINEAELQSGSKKSWHDMYSQSAYIFIGGLSYDLTEGDVLAVFSQCGEIVNINLVRDKKTGKPKGFCFLCYDDQRSTILAVDNLNGIKLCGRTIRVDHVSQYRRPKDESGNEIIEKGCAPKTPTPSPTPSPLPAPEQVEEKKKRVKKNKDKKKKKKKKLKLKKKHRSSETDSDTDEHGSSGDEMEKVLVHSKKSSGGLERTKRQKYDVSQESGEAVSRKNKTGFTERQMSPSPPPRHRSVGTVSKKRAQLQSRKEPRLSTSSYSRSRQRYREERDRSSSGSRDRKDSRHTYYDDLKCIKTDRSRSRSRERSEYHKRHRNQPNRA